MKGEYITIQEKIAFKIKLWKAGKSLEKNLQNSYGDTL